MHLHIGAEGTLGIITKLYLKLVALPKHQMDLLAVFDNLDDAIALTPKVMNAGITPVCVEFMDNASIKQVEIFLDEKLPHSDNGNYIIIQIAGDSEDVLDDQCEKSSNWLKKTMRLTPWLLTRLLFGNPVKHTSKLTVLVA